jgi:hypothetical protein
MEPSGGALPRSWPAKCSRSTLRIQQFVQRPKVLQHVQASRAARRAKPIYFEQREVLLQAICFRSAYRRKVSGMNQMERDFRPDGLAEVEYLDGEYRIVKPGSFVLCALTGERIPIEALRYWSVDLQEAYASPASALKRFQDRGLTPG